MPFPWSEVVSEAVEKGVPVEVRGGLFRPKQLRIGAPISEAAAHAGKTRLWPWLLGGGALAGGAYLYKKYRESMRYPYYQLGKYGSLFPTPADYYLLRKLAQGQSPSLENIPGIQPPVEGVSEVAKKVRRKASEAELSFRRFGSTLKKVVKPYFTTEKGVRQLLKGTGIGLGVLGGAAVASRLINPPPPNIVKVGQYPFLREAILSKLAQRAPFEFEIIPAHSGVPFSEDIWSAIVEGSRPRVSRSVPTTPSSIPTTSVSSEARPGFMRRLLGRTKEVGKRVGRATYQSGRTISGGIGTLLGGVGRGVYATGAGLGRGLYATGAGLGGLFRALGQRVLRRSAPAAATAATAAATKGQAAQKVVQTAARAAARGKKGAPWLPLVTGLGGLALGLPLGWGLGGRRPTVYVRRREGGSSPEYYQLGKYGSLPFGFGGNDLNFGGNDMILDKLGEAFYEGYLEGLTEASAYHPLEKFAWLGRSSRFRQKVSPETRQHILETFQEELRKMMTPGFFRKPTKKVLHLGFGDPAGTLQPFEVKLILKSMGRRRPSPARHLKKLQAIGRLYKRLSRRLFG